MDRKLVKGIISVLLGIALITLIISCVSLLFDALFMDDVISLNGSAQSEAVKLNEVLKMLKWMVVSLLCVIVPAIACYVYAYFGNGKIFNIIAAVLSVFIAATCIAFICVLRKAAFDTGSASIYSAVTASFEEFITLIASSLLICSFFVYNAVMSFKKSSTEKALVESAEVHSNEEI